MKARWILVSLLVFGACVDDSEDAEVPDDELGKADAARLARGTYELSSPTPDHIHIKTMVLLGTRFRNEIHQVGLSLDMTGTYRLSRLQSTGERRIRFTEAPASMEDTQDESDPSLDDTAAIVLAYEIDADKTITFTDRSEDPDAVTFRMRPAKSLWCAEPADCEAQRFGSPADGEITCTQNQCAASTDSE